MGESFGTAAETHSFTEVVSAFCAVFAVFAHDAGLDGHSLAGYEVFYAWANGCDDTSCFVAKNEGCLECKVTISTMQIIVDWLMRNLLKQLPVVNKMERLTVATTETCGDYSDLGLVVLRWPKGTVFNANIFGAVENGGVLGRKSNWRHLGENCGRVGRTVEAFK